MRITEVGGGASIRLVLTAMITNRQTLAAIADKWESPGLFGEKWADLVGGWCVSHYLKYGKAPGKSIETVYEKWSAKTKDASAELVGQFLGKLSEKYASRKKSVNPEHALDEAKLLFQTAKAKQLRDDIDADLSAGEPTKALARINAFTPPQIGTGIIIDLFSDVKGMEEDLSNPKSDILVTYPGAIGKFFDDAFSIGNFVAFAAPEKTGKSWWLLDVVMRAAEQSRNVLYLQIGDMTRKQIRRRFASRIAKRPFKPGTAKVPIQLDTAGEADVQFKEFTYEDYLSPERGRRALEKLVKRNKGVEDKVKMVVQATKSLSVSGIRSIIDGLNRSGWVPQIIVLDYADLLAPPGGFQGESRDAINENWAELRAISHSHCVVTGTQVKRTAYKAEVIEKDDMADDKRKLAHVTALYGVNVKDDEKKIGVSRLNHVVLREGEFITTDCVTCAGCLAIANPVVMSSF